jgi:hypothetical protein
MRARFLPLPDSLGRVRRRVGARDSDRRKARRARYFVE